MLKPSSARYSSSPAALKYSVTISEPGARLVLTQGLTVSPRCTAFRASSPAPIMTLGFDVLVQIVIAATTTAPWSRPSMPGGTSAVVARAAAAGAAAAAAAAVSPGFGDAAA